MGGGRGAVSTRFAEFVTIWGSSHYPPDPVNEADLVNAERSLGVGLPDDYRAALIGVGVPRLTIALLDAIVERKLDLRDVSEFCAPAEIVSQTADWHGGGMPERLIVFASDCAGNLFCFDRDRLEQGEDGGRGVWFFDHDFGTVERVASGFAAWLAAYCEVEPCPDAEGG